MTIDHRLAVYGTLAPGQCNHHQLAMLDGRWSTGWVTGRLVTLDRGPAAGYPGLIIETAADRVDVHLLTSPGLPAHWSRLDAFEGPGYRRVVVQIATPAGDRAAWIYEALHLE
jgi:gamma-glutamylcyclotransferase (GGCT)/AIG2-like uncharacterized protein YtfP